MIRANAFPRGATMSRRTLAVYAPWGVFALLAGVLVFLHSLDAKPKKKDSGDPAARKAGTSTASGPRLPVAPSATSARGSAAPRG